MDSQVFVIPCSGAKLPHSAPARDLYTGSMFRQVLAAVEQEAEATERECGITVRVMILSARYGLVDLDTVLSPYDVTMSGPESITPEQLAEQVTALTAGGGSWELFAFLPRAYLRRLAQAVDIVNDSDALPGWLCIQDVYEAAPGIGHQRHVAASLCTLAPAAVPRVAPVAVMPAWRPRAVLVVSYCRTVAPRALPPALITLCNVCRHSADVRWKGRTREGPPWAGSARQPAWARSGWSGGATAASGPPRKPSARAS